MQGIPFLRGYSSTRACLSSCVVLVLASMCMAHGVCMESARAASGERRDDMQYTHRETRDATGGGIEKIILEQI